MKRSLLARLAEASARLVLAAPLVIASGPLAPLAAAQCLEGAAKVLRGDDLGCVVGLSPGRR